MLLCCFLFCFCLLHVVEMILFFLGDVDQKICICDVNKKTCVEVLVELLDEQAGHVLEQTVSALELHFEA